MNDQVKKSAAVYKTNRDGRSVVRGYHAVDPSGHLVLLAPPGELPDSEWRYATAADVKAAKDAEAARSKEAPPSDGGPLQ